MGVSLNGGTPKSSILIEFSIINHPFWGTSILGNPHMYLHLYHKKSTKCKYNSIIYIYIIHGLSGLN